MNKEQAGVWAQTVAPTVLASNVRRFHWMFLDGTLGQTAFGFVKDRNPVEGKIVAVADDAILLKEGRTALVVIARDVLPPMEFFVNSKIRVTPYARRRFDGARIDAGTPSGDGCTVYKMGEQYSYLPIDKASLRCEYLIEMVNQIEKLRADNDFRTIAQVLIDAGARTDIHPNPVTFVDPSDDDDIILTPPSITFRVQNATINGCLSVVYDRGVDYYDVRTVTESGEDIETRTDVSFDELANVVREMLHETDAWRIARVEVLQPAPKRRAS